MSSYSLKTCETEPALANQCKQITADNRTADQLTVIDAKRPVFIPVLHDKPRNAKMQLTETPEIIRHSRQEYPRRTSSWLMKNLKM